MCLRGSTSSLFLVRRLLQGPLLKETCMAAPGDDSQSCSQLGPERQYLRSWLKHFFSNGVLKRELDWDKLCVVVLGINEYEKLNYWILQCKLHFAHKFFISEC